MATKDTAGSKRFTALTRDSYQKGSLVIQNKCVPKWCGKWMEDAVNDEGELYRKHVTVRLGKVSEMTEAEAREKMAQYILDHGEPVITAQEKHFVGTVYFVQGSLSKKVKIGFSNFVIIRKRLSQLQTGSSELLQLVGLFPGNKKTEQAFHETFADERIHGEWFEGPRVSEFVSHLNFDPRLAQFRSDESVQ